MVHKPSIQKFRLAVVDRGGLASSFEGLIREQDWPIEVLSCASALEVIGENGPGPVEGLAVSVAAAGPFLTDLLRWTDGSGDRRVPALLAGSGVDSDEAAARMSLTREHVRWIAANPDRGALLEWLRRSFEVHLLRSYRREHEAIAAAIREARVQLFHGFIHNYAPPEGPPCGPPLPTSIEEITPLRDARAQFERAHIKSAVREWGSLKEAAAALGISYTSLWRRLR
jgi:hypothetical protein